MSANPSLQDIILRLRNILLEAANLQKELEIRRLKKQQLQHRLSVSDVSNVKSITRPKEQDLTKWTYANLRNAINSKSEVDAALVESCREEYLRRMKVYQSWKRENNETKTVEKHPVGPVDEALDTPHDDSWLTEEESSSVVGMAIEERFYKAPLTKCYGIENAVNIRGWLYTHLRGDTVARHMEIFPGKEPVLFTAGKDEVSGSVGNEQMDMRNGKSISRKEFDSEWRKRGGALTALDEMLQLVDDGQLLLLEHSEDNSSA